MQVYDSITSAREGVLNLLITHGSDLPDDIRQQVVSLSSSPSPVDQIVRTAELLYARREEITKEAKTVAAALASYAASNGWHGLTVDNRGGRIAQALWRDNGEEPAAGAPFPEPETDPAPAAEFAPAPDPAPLPAGPTE